MKRRETALRLFERIADYNYPVAFERTPSGKKEPSEYMVVVDAQTFGPTEIIRVAKLAKDEDVKLHLRAADRRTFMVLS